MSTPKTPGTPSAGQPGQQKGRRQEKIGRVSSDKMQKTIVVSVETLKRHPLYRRTYKSTNKFKAHDEQTMPVSATWWHRGDAAAQQRQALASRRDPAARRADGCRSSRSRPR